MDLRRYLFEYRISQKEFAEKIDYTRAYVSTVVQGKHFPSPRAAKAIKKASNGVVCYVKEPSNAPESEAQDLIHE